MRLVLFDMDHTLVPCDSGTLWAEFLSEQNLLSREKVQQRAAFLQDYQNGTLDVEAAYRFELELLKSLPLSERNDLLQGFFTHKIRPLITESAQRYVERHKQDGDYVVIITATVEDIARPVADFFGVDALIAGRGKRDEFGEYTGEVELEPCMGRGKLVHLEEWLTKNNYNPLHYVFYSDSHNDLPLLEQVDDPIAVDPDEKLRQIALENDWQIISFLD